MLEKESKEKASDIIEGKEDAKKNTINLPKSLFPETFLTGKAKGDSCRISFCVNDIAGQDENSVKVVMEDYSFSIYNKPEEIKG